MAVCIWSVDRKPRHIEYQILADEHGNAMHLYERSARCSVGIKKLIEESPAPGIDAKVLREQAQRGADICARLGYNNLGTMRLSTVTVIAVFWK